MIWINALAGIFLSAVYITAALRIWSRRSHWWSLLAIANALIYVYPTATYIWNWWRGELEVSDFNPLGLALFILPAILVLKMISWGIRDEAEATVAVQELIDGHGSSA